MSPDPPVSLWVNADSLGLLTDLYQLTMMAGYFATGRADLRATFEVFVRKLPASRSFLVFAGLEQLVGDLLMLNLSDQSISDLRALPAFQACPETVFEQMRGLRFTGDLWSVPEGTVVFAGEPLIRVEARLAEAQWLETLALASIGYPTLVASKAARVVLAANGKPLFDFGLRRGHGPQAGLLAARASAIAGFEGTSNVEAAMRLGLPCSGTMAHSWVQSFEDESESFSEFAQVFPGATTLLVDTFDTPRGVARAAAIEPAVQAIRIDSGDLGPLAFQARRILNERNRSSVKIFGSGDLDEFRIADLVKADAPFDAFGVGTEVVTSRDAPALAIVYKLVAIDGEGRIKLSHGKQTYPFAKQVFRQVDTVGRFLADQVTRFDEVRVGEPLLSPVIQHGKLVAALPRLDAIQSRCRSQLNSLPTSLKDLDSIGSYPVTFSDRLETEARRLREAHS